MYPKQACQAPIWIVVVEVVSYPSDGGCQRFNTALEKFQLCKKNKISDKMLK